MPRDLLGQSGVAANPHAARQQRVERAQPAVRHAQPGLAAHDQGHVGVLGRTLMGGGGKSAALNVPVLDAFAVEHAQMQARRNSKTFKGGREPADAFARVLLMRLQQRLQRRERSRRFVANRGPDAFSPSVMRNLLARSRAAESLCSAGHVLGDVRHRQAFPLRLVFRLTASRKYNRRANCHRQSLRRG